MTSITSALSNFMYRRSAERVETEEPADVEEAARDNNSITEEDGEEGEFVGTSTTDDSFESSQQTPILESLPHDEDLNESENTEDARNEQPTENVMASNADSSAPVIEAVIPTSRSRTRRGYSLRDLEEERELVQRRTGGCVLFSSFILLRLWIQAVMTGDFGLLLLCLVFTSWTARFVRYTREREDELNRMINEWDENSDEEPAFINDARLQRMSFQSQLALAIMQSQIQMMEGGYGHPDGGESRPGVGDDAKGQWDRFEYQSTSSLAKRGEYGSVFEQKSGDFKSNDEGPTCSICLCEYEKGEKLIQLPCKHVFHEDCITSWTDHNTRCPLCNADLESMPGNERV